MFSRPSCITGAFLLVVATMASHASSFQVRPTVGPHERIARASTTTSPLLAFGKKKEDLSFIETRDMTREEMLALNAENERVMNSELIGMTVFSLIISLPLLYLAWVGLFADTAEIAMNN